MGSQLRQPNPGSWLVLSSWGKLFWIGFTTDDATRTLTHFFKDGSSLTGAQLRTQRLGSAAPLETEPPTITVPQAAEPRNKMPKCATETAQCGTVLCFSQPGGGPNDTTPG